jgi:DNA topoisomerase-3
VKVVNGKTRPPARYNEATLLAAMEHPGKFIDDDRLREAMDAGSGLGTPATRADILEKLFDSFYMERRGKEISPTAKGKQLIELVPADLKSPELTARWEMMLLRISKGQADSQKFTADMRLYAAKLVSGVIADTGTYKHENLTREKCPTCGKFMLEVNGKRGKMLVCVDRECGARVNLTQTSNARCPECHKKMEMRGDGDNKAFFCGCGYREKLSAFKERVGDRVDKREVTQFLQNQEAPDNINSAMAEALRQWGK